MAPAEVAVSTLAPNQYVTVGSLHLDLDARQLRDEIGRDVPLTSVEFELLKMFVERPDRLLSRGHSLRQSARQPRQGVRWLRYTEGDGRTDYREQSHATLRFHYSTFFRAMPSARKTDGERR